MLYSRTLLYILYIVVYIYHQTLYSPLLYPLVITKFVFCQSIPLAFFWGVQANCFGFTWNHLFSMGMVFSWHVYSWGFVFLNVLWLLNVSGSSSSSNSKLCQDSLHICHNSEHKFWSTWQGSRYASWPYITFLTCMPPRHTASCDFWLWSFFSLSLLYWNSWMNLWPTKLSWIKEQANSIMYTCVLKTLNECFFKIIKNKYNVS